MPGASVTRMSLELAHALLQRAQPAHQLRKHGFGCPDPSGERGRPARSAAHHLPRLHVAGYARLRGEDGPFPDGHVIGDADLAGQDGAIANGAGARDADLGHQDHVLADRAVVAHLYEVVDLAPAADDGVAQRGAVDGGVGADLDVVGDAKTAYLGNLAMRGAIEGVAEAIRSQHGAGVHDHAMADEHARVDHRARMQHHVVGEHGARAHETEGADSAARPDHRAPFHHRAGAYGGARVDPGSGRDYRRGMHAGGDGTLGMEQAQERNEGDLRGVDAQQGLGQPGDVAGDDESRRRASGSRLEVLGGGDERHVVRPGLLEGGDAGDDTTAISFEGGAERLGELPEREGDGHGAYFLAFRISSSKALITSSVTSTSGAPYTTPACRRSTMTA